ncbi:DUF6446 family protein [Jannaschia sp. LMIT008]|uniref:DUF6446 family protein n=1 Tax=Jannaschia maritima TaxID=3032585 RepID=UPI0028121C0A|nr:DUF6446 family protein [Jannaschia sp. LMIT008]
MTPARRQTLGKAVILSIAVICALGGAGLWYTQVHAYWDELDGPVTLPVDATDVAAIASASSPLGFRACFRHDGTPIDAAPVANPAPTVAPGWFDCFDAEAVADLLASGQATAHVAVKNAAYGVDRIVALADDGRGWAWHELNDCGRKSFDGSVVGEACPDRDTFTPLAEGQD